MRRRAQGVAVFGRDRELLQKCILARSRDFRMTSAELLSDALDWCWRESRAGDTILLSPACDES